VGYSIDGGSNITASGNNTYVYGLEGMEPSGYNTLTLYTNDTAGKWATPQTVFYFVEYYADVTGAAPATSPTPSPSIPEFPTWIIPPIFMAATLLTVVFIRKRITKNNAFFDL
jgi:hypothetical protein